MKVLVDCGNLLAPNITNLLNKIFETRDIPDQWKVSKILPLHKKGDKKDINNYRPISNICSLAKMFEKTVLYKLSELERINSIDLTNKNQHGFKKVR